VVQSCKVLVFLMEAPGDQVIDCHLAAHSTAHLVVTNMAAQTEPKLDLVPYVTFLLHRKTAELLRKLYQFRP